MAMQEPMPLWHGIPIKIFPKFYGARRTDAGLPV